MSINKRGLRSGGKKKGGHSVLFFTHSVPRTASLVFAFESEKRRTLLFAAYRADEQLPSLKFF
ncbi:hypothetical protein EB241_07700 [Erwinia psidii]|uniref:Uncharacterized protein n=1 Tax=Erwinia psidii TaxID=69224 RepID=A0A3N6SII7_9GAMM|nr:hypothetical protein EB241_07700 [Erwinia psidii]